MYTNKKNENKKSYPFFSIRPHHIRNLKGLLGWERFLIQWSGCKLFSESEFFCRQSQDPGLACSGGVHSFFPDLFLRVGGITFSTPHKGIGLQASQCYWEVSPKLPIPGSISQAFLLDFDLICWHVFILVRASGFSDFLQLLYSETRFRQVRWHQI